MPETFYFRSVLPRVSHFTIEPWRAASGWWLADAGISPDAVQPLVESRQRAGLDPAAALLAAIFDFHASQHSCTIIGEKTPDHVSNISQIQAWFPQAKVIQILRDPRAVVASFQKVKVGSNAVADITAEWARTTRILESRIGTEGYLYLRYEDLVSEPEIILREVCNFLGTDWNPEILNFHNRTEAGYAPEQTHHRNTRRALFKGSVDSWKYELSSSNVALIEWTLRDMMERHGYALTGKTALAPQLRMAISRFGGQAHRLFVRAPRQRLKALRANRRLAKKG